MRMFEFCEMFGYEEVPDSIVLAASILEARGKKFCVDFGFFNAVEQAEEVLTREAAIA